jgi:hypothetical protein
MPPPLPVELFEETEADIFDDVVVFVVFVVGDEAYR